MDIKGIDCSGGLGAMALACPDQGLAGWFCKLIVCYIATASKMHVYTRIYRRVYSV
jgi:hypothetical protein